MKFKLFLTLLFFILSRQAIAENGCPDGMTPFQNGGDPVPTCYPIQGNQNNAPSQPRGHWETRWGAIATDAPNGLFGAAKNLTNKSKAKKAAIAQCQVNGGTACEFQISYYNQCAVIAWGDSWYVVQSKETVEAASKLALSQCSG